MSYSPGWLVVWVLRKYFVKSDYKAARESIKFFEVANFAYAAQKKLKAQRLLTIAFRLLGDHVPKSYASLLHSAIAGTLKDPSTRKSFSYSIFLATKEIPVETANASGWYQLSRGLFSLGYFRAAWIAREISLDLSISEALAPDTSATNIQRGIEAHLERRNFSDAEVLIMRATSGSSADRISEFREDSAMMQGKVLEFSNHSTNADHEALAIFNNLIFDKEVALVGLGAPSGEYGVQIDATDTVMRLKFVGLENLPDSKYHGTRCEISQYNLAKPLVEYSALKQGAIFLDSLTLIITLDASLLEIRGVPVLSRRSECSMYRSTAVSGLRCLKTAIKGNPQSLKIYGFDFYTKIEQYGNEVLGFFRSDVWQLGGTFVWDRIGHFPKFEITNSFSGHDPVSNFCFAQNLYKAGLFEIEPYGKSILELTPYQYVERLEEMLGDW